MKGVPNSWAVAPIVDLLLPHENGKPLQQGWSPQCENYPASDESWGVLKTTAIQPGQFWDHENKKLPEGLNPRPHIEVQVGDLLMTCAGPRTRCGVVCLVEHTRPKLMISGKMYRFRPNGEVMNPRFLAHFIQSRSAQVAIDVMKTGINDSGLNLTHDRFATLAVPVAPRFEQHRIVDKIEELFSELDKGVENLTIARDQLKTYRQSVLKHAFDGALTEDWRARNSDKLEHPEALLARIKKERDDCYKTALAKWREALAERRVGDERPAKPKPPRQLSKLADAGKTNGVWPIVELGDLLSVSSGFGLTTQQMRDGPYAVYGGNGINGRHDKYFVDEPELVIGRVGAKCGVTHITLPKSWVTDNALIVTPLISSFEKHFFKWLLEIKNLNILGSSTGQPVISGSKIYPVEISFPSYAEQVEIVRILLSKLEAADVMEAEIDIALARANALRQSILIQAFSGRLARQDAADEPASILLKRIRVENGARTANRKRHNSKKEAA